MSQSFNRDRRFFLCTGQVVTVNQLTHYPKSHIMGELKYVDAFHQRKKVTALALYEASLPVLDVPTSLPEIRVDIIGNAVQVKCTRCHHRRRWSIGRSALLQLIAQFEKTYV